MNDLGSDVQDFDALLKGLTPKQLEFIEKRLLASSDSEGARLAGVAPGTVSRWKKEGTPIDRVIELSRQDGVHLAREQLRRLATKAVRVLEEEMDKKRSAKRLDAACEVLDRIGIEARKGIDLGTKDPLTVVFTVRDDGQESNT